MSGPRISWQAWGASIIVHIALTALLARWMGSVSGRASPVAKGTRPPTPFAVYRLPLLVSTESTTPRSTARATSSRRRPSPVPPDTTVAPAVAADPAVASATTARVPPPGPASPAARLRSAWAYDPSRASARLATALALPSIVSQLPERPACGPLEFSCLRRQVRWTLDSAVFVALACTPTTPVWWRVRECSHRQGDRDTTQTVIATPSAPR